MIDRDGTVRPEASYENYGPSEQLLITKIQYDFVDDWNPKCALFILNTNFIKRGNRR